MDISDDEFKKIKDEIIDNLSKESIDLSEVLNLTTELSKLDQDNVRFTVDADHVSRLGLELVAKKESALSEIIKNSFDADADTVYVNFLDNGAEKKIEIVDNGSGMSRDDLINGFMRISTALKKDNEYSKKYGRKRAGKKGIGRFATQRLGLDLTVLTKEKDQESCLRVDIDWRKFAEKKELISVSNKILVQNASVFEEHGFKSGTILIIGSLRDEWTDSQVRRAYRYASSLIIPFPISQNNYENSSLEKNTGGEVTGQQPDPGFDVTVKRVSKDSSSKIVDSTDMYLKHALAVIEGWIDQSGYGHWRVVSDFIGYDSGVKGYATKTLGQYQDRESARDNDFYFPHVRNVHFKAYYFSPKSKPHIPKLQVSLITENLRDYGGIRLYRNGFRVLPYGEKYDDWLRLDYYSKTRTILPPFGNGNFFGVVDISPETEGYFEEVASREGLLETESFNELRDFVSSSIFSAIVDVSYALGGTKVFASERNYKKTKKPTFKETLESLNESLEDLDSLTPLESSSNSLSNSSEIAPQDEEVRFVPNRIIQSIKAGTKALSDKAEIYRILAGLGLSMAEFTHEVKFSIFRVSNSLARVERKVSDQDLASDIKKTLSAVDNLRAYTSFFEASFQSLSNKEGELLDVRKIINEFIDALKDTKHEDENIKVALETDGLDFVLPKAHKANFDSILVNLYSNAKKAIYRNGGEGKITIRLVELENNVEMLFSDDGCGISEDIKESIFDEFFTTNNQAFDVPESQQMLGMGLGLTIVKEIIEGLGGEIEIREPEQGYATSFGILFPKADEKDIENDF